MSSDDIFRLGDYLLSIIDLPKEKFGVSRVAFELLIKMIPYIDK